MAEQQISIIIVEDEPEFRRRFVQIVENEPSMKLVGAASNKREAQAIIDRESFEVMLIDLGLPDGSGIELIRQVSQKKPDVDIMVVTVFGDEQHVVSSIEAGATGYIRRTRRRPTSSRAFACCVLADLRSVRLLRAACCARFATG
jgi:DNA-binding NarL/FixJ family response regulator